MMGFHPAKFGLPRPFRSVVLLIVEARDRQTERHRRSFYNAPYRGRVIIIRTNGSAMSQRNRATPYVV